MERYCRSNERQIDDGSQCAAWGSPSSLAVTFGALGVPQGAVAGGTPYSGSHTTMAALTMTHFWPLASSTTFRPPFTALGVTLP